MTLTLPLSTTPVFVLSVFIGIPAAQVALVGAQGTPFGAAGPPESGPYQKRLSAPKSMKCSTSSRQARASSVPQSNVPR